MKKTFLTYICLTLVGVMGFSLGTIGSYAQTTGNGLGTQAGIVSSAANLQAGNAISPSPKATPTSDKAIKEKEEGLIYWLNTMLAALTILVSPVIMLASWLMSPDWTSGDLFGIRGVLYRMWIFVANVTYFIYAVLLIVIALATIFNSEKYGYKALLPKLALGIILVPFTWWFIQFIISLATVVTTSVMTIPYESLKPQLTQNSWWNKPVVPKKIEYTNDTSKKGTIKQLESIGCEYEPKNCLSPQDITEKASGIYSPLLIYGFGIFKFQEIKNINTFSDVISTGAQVVHQALIGMIFFIMFGLLTMALTAMLMVRAVKLWFYAIFSPLMTLKYVMGDGFFGGKENSDNFEMKEFIGLAFVPAIVGVCLSLGLITVALLQQGGGPGASQCTETDIKSEKGCTILTLAGNPENKIVRKAAEDGDRAYTSINEFHFGGLSFVFNGSAGGSVEDITKGANAISGTLSSTGGIIGMVIIDIICLLFIWIAFMAGKNVSKAVKAAVAPFEEMGNKIGKLAMTLPKYTPLPLPGGSIAGMQKTTELGSNALTKSLDEKAMASIGKSFPNLVQGIIKPEQVQEIKNAISTHKNQGEEGAKKFFETITRVASTSEKNDANNATLRQYLKEFSESNDDLLKLVDKKLIGTEKEIVTKYIKGEELSKFDQNKASDLLQRTFGSASSGNTTNPVTTSAATNGNGTIGIRNVSINYNGINLSETPVQIGQKIAEHLNAEKARFQKPTDDILKQIVKDIGVAEGRRSAVFNELKSKLDSDGFKQGT